MKIFNVMLLNTCSRNKRRKNCEESRWRSQSALVRPLAMSYLNRCQDLIGSLASTHSTFNLIGSCNKHSNVNIQRYKDAKPQRYICSHHWHMSYFFQNSSKIPQWTLRKRPQRNCGTLPILPMENMDNLPDDLLTKLSTSWCVLCASVT